MVRSAGETVDKLKTLVDFNIGEKTTDWLAQKVEGLQVPPMVAPPTQFAPPPKVANIAARVVDLAEQHWPKPAEAGNRPPLPPKIPIPPPIRIRPGRK